LLRVADEQSGSSAVLIASRKNAGTRSAREFDFPKALKDVAGADLSRA